ncbi:Proposed lipoate regulatory protein YbeD [uncultured Candidatus Thioglobus sp.]|nr:Proposed lipoate regulatory protein YbeD [uncultured Candidatus Thioglobus sp.]
MTQQTNFLESLLQFPCSFPIKALGKATEDLQVLVVEIIQRYCSDALPASAVTTRPSHSGNYIAVTVTIAAQNQQQLDGIYLALTRNEKIVMVF